MCKEVLKRAVWAVLKQGLECVGHRQKKKGTLKTDSLQNPPGSHTGLWGYCVEPGRSLFSRSPPPTLPGKPSLP